MGEIAKDILDQTKGVAVEVYKDVVKPSAQPLGVVLSYLPRTLRLAFSKWEKWIVNGEESIRIAADMLREKVKQIPEEKLVEPEAYVAVPAIQQLMYCQDNDTLRDLYANLLASSMNTDKKWQVHPAFVDIIKQLTPDEAKIIKSIPDLKNNFLPLVDVKLYDKSANLSGGHQLFITNFTTIGIDVIENKANICSYVDNLIRLNILEIPGSYHLTDATKYEPLEKHPVLAELVPSYFHNIYDIAYNHKALLITNFGLMFKRICCS